MIESNNRTLWIDHAISAWNQSGTKLNPGVSLAKISEFENLLNFKFPQDFVELYQRVNGFAYCDWNEHMFSFWSLERIADEYQGDDDSSFVGFCDFLISSHSIGFLKENNKIFKHFDGLNPVCNTFKEAVILINSSSGNIY